MVPLANRGIGYDALRDVLLVSVAGSVPTLGNHLVEMDPLDGTLGRSVALPGGPGVIAVADDGSRAYVGLRDSPVIAEIDLTTFNVVREIALGVDPTFGPQFAEDIEVQPGNAEVIAVSRDDCCSTARGGVAIFDAGVQRPTTVPRTNSPNRITWGDAPDTLYGYYNGSTGYPFYVLTVNAQGVTATSPGKLVTGFNVDIEYANGAVHATSGQVVDVIGSPVLAGSYITSGQIEVDPATDTTTILNGTTLSRHHATRLLQKGSETVASITPRQLVGAGSLLAAAGDNSVMLLGEGVSSSGFMLPSAPPSIVGTTGATTVPLSVGEMAASPDGAFLYATVPQAAATHPGEIVEIDVASGAVTRSVFVGADPLHLALSQDGSTLMVGHVSASKLTEVRVDDLSVVRAVQLPIGQFVGDIAAMPGSPTTFAVTEDDQRSGPQVDGTFLVRDGVIVVNPVRIRFAPTTIAFTDDPSKLYGHDGSNTGFDFSTLSIDASGLQVASTVGDLLRGFDVEIIARDGRIYSSDGGVVDPVVPMKLGVVSPGHPVPVPARDRLLTVSNNKIQEFDLDGFWPVATTTFSGGNATDATLAGDTLAIATAAGSLVLLPLG